MVINSLSRKVSYIACDHLHGTFYTLGYLGPEFEAMLLYPSLHFGIYHPLDQEYKISSLKASFGIGILL
jgi:hypothetical protein